MCFLFVLLDSLQSCRLRAQIANVLRFRDGRRRRDDWEVGCQERVHGKAISLKNGGMPCDRGSVCTKSAPCTNATRNWCVHGLQQSLSLIGRVSVLWLLFGQVIYRHELRSEVQDMGDEGELAET